MVLIARTCAVVTLGSLLSLPMVSGCSQSLFDATTGDDEQHADAGGGPDSNTMTPDADPLAPDANPMLPDANPMLPDAGGSTCTTGCLGDLVGEFDDVQGGTLGRFHYQDDTRAAYNAYADMSLGMWAGIAAWVGGGTMPTPAIVNCGDFPAAGPCAGITDRVLLSPTNNTMGMRDPVVAWTAPLSGTVHLVGDYRVADGVTGMQQKVLVSRNTRNDLLFKDQYLPSTSPEAIDFFADVLVGDQLLLTVTPPASGAPAPTGFKLKYLDGDAFPGACQLVLDMEGPDTGQTDACGGAMFEDLDFGNPGMHTAAAASFSADFGNARVFTEGDYLHPLGGAMDYSGDFTVQWWMRNDQAPGGDSTVETVMADWECALKRGLALGFRSYVPVFYVQFFSDPAKDYCGFSGTADPAEGFSATMPTDDGWHFYRVTRSTSDGNLKFCIDGQTRGMVSVAAAADISSGIAPNIGQTIDGQWPYFSGTIDDFRVYKRALPCPTLP